MKILRGGRQQPIVGFPKQGNLTSRTKVKKRKGQGSTNTKNFQKGTPAFLKEGRKVKLGEERERTSKKSGNHIDINKIGGEEIVWL